MIWYFPLEPYEERYTMQMSAPKTGWVESFFIKNDIRYKRVEPVMPDDNKGSKYIENGFVLDACRRGMWATGQVQRFLHYLEQREVKKGDVLYFDDFWHPGIEAIAYARHMMKKDFRMYAYQFAQSVDEYDFTAKMLPWIRPYEIGNAKILDGFFVNNQLLKDKCIQGWANHNDCGEMAAKIHITGYPFSFDEVAERMKDNEMGDMISCIRENQVIFASRWDTEKKPDFFLEVAEIIKNEEMVETKFIVCTSSNKVKSNDPELLKLLEAAEKRGIVEVKTGITKNVYYSLLQNSKVLFSSGLQDWVGYCLLEGCVAGVTPIYPYHRSYIDAFEYMNLKELTYEPWNEKDAVEKICQVLNGSSMTEETKDTLWSLPFTFDLSMERIYKVMMNQPYKELWTGEA